MEEVKIAFRQREARILSFKDVQPLIEILRDSLEAEGLRINAIMVSTGNSNDPLFVKLQRKRHD